MNYVADDKCQQNVVVSHGCQWQIGSCPSGSLGPVYEHSSVEVDTLSYWKPVQLVKYRWPVRYGYIDECQVVGQLLDTSDWRQDWYVTSVKPVEQQLRTQPRELSFWWVQAANQASMSARNILSSCCVADRCAVGRHHTDVTRGHVDVELVSSYRHSDIHQRSQDRPSQIAEYNCVLVSWPLYAVCCIIVDINLSWVIMAPFQPSVMSQLHLDRCFVLQPSRSLPVTLKLADHKCSLLIMDWIEQCFTSRPRHFFTFDKLDFLSKSLATYCCFFCSMMASYWRAWCWILVAMQEGELNQTSTEKKLNAGNASPAVLANGSKQSNGYDSPRIGRRFEKFWIVVSLRKAKWTKV